MSTYFSLGASVESRIIQSREPESAGEKMTRKKKREEIFPRFRRARFLKHAPVPTRADKGWAMKRALRSSFNV